MARMKDLFMETMEAIAFAPARAKEIEKEAMDLMIQELETNHDEKSDAERDFEYDEQKRDLDEMEKELDAYRTNVVLELNIILTALKSVTDEDANKPIIAQTTWTILVDARERMKWVMAAIDAGKLW